MTSIRKTYCQDRTVIYWMSVNFLYYYIREANHTSCPNIQYQLVKELNGDMSNKLVKLCHMKLGRSKSQQEEVNGTEGKWALLSLAALSLTFFFQLALPAILPLLYSVRSSSRPEQERLFRRERCQGMSQRHTWAEPQCCTVTERRRSKRN